MSKKIILSVFLFCTTLFYAQVGIGTTNPNPSAMLDISSGTGGILIPRISLEETTSPTPIPVGPDSPAEGLMVYNIATDNDVTPGFYYWDQLPSPGRWVRINSGASTDWALTGNAGTTPGTNFIGTTDAQPLRIRTDNTEQFEITTDGRLRANNSGTQAFPTYSFDENTNMGMYRQGNNDLRLATGGNGRFQITNTFLRSFQNHRFANGNASTPAISFNASQNTGIFRPDDNIIGFSTDGAERMRIVENGNVGINTIPSERFHVDGNMKLDGAFMPGGDAGNTDQILISKGAGNKPEWGPGFLNVGEISNIGKAYFSATFPVASPWPNNTFLTITVIDADCRFESSISASFTGWTAGVSDGITVRNISTENGQFRVTLVNQSGGGISGTLQMSYLAFY